MLSNAQSDKRMGDTLTFVTFLISRNNGILKGLDHYVEQFSKLASCGHKFLVFLDPELKDVGELLQLKFSNVKVLRYLGIHDLRVHKLYQDVSPVLPRERSMNKDTEDYMILQNSKLDCMAMALPYCETNWIAWIDFGICHMFRHNGLDNIKTLPSRLKCLCTDKIYSPSRTSRHEKLWDKVSWKFLGSFLLSHVSNDIKLVADKSFEILSHHAPKLTWEVNLWCMMEEFFKLYSADHNDTITLVTD